MSKPRGFTPIKDRAPFDETELVETLAYFDATLPESYLDFLRENYDSYHHPISVGFRAFECSRTLGPRSIRVFADGHFWGKEFMPFMSGSYGFAAFDLRGQTATSDPSVVFLLWDDEDDYDIAYDKVIPMGEDLDGFLDLLGVWSRPEGQPRVEECFDRGPFQEMGVEYEVAVRPQFAMPGDVLRSGLFGPDRLRVGHLMGCVESCEVAPELVAELSIGETYECFKLVVGDRLVPFMTGEDGWLALDYRQTDSVPPVVVVGREGDRPSGVIEPAAVSILDAFTKFR